MSKPLHNFEQTMLRAEALLDMYDDRQFHISQNSTGATAFIEEDDLIRSAVIVSVAALDHYFTSKFSDILVRHLKTRTPSKELLSILEKAGLTTRVALELAIMKRPFRRIRTMLQNHLSRYTSHRVEAIDKLFCSVGLIGLCGRVEAKVKRKSLLKRIDQLVTLRNEIAHTGHLNSRGKPKTIHIEKTRGLLQELSFFVHAAERNH